MQEMPWTWDAEALAMRPAPKYAGLARSRLEHGRVYVLKAEDQVSAKERSRFHALLRKAHSNLSEADTAAYPSPTALRHHCLIKTGWYHDSYFDAASPQAAGAMSAWLLKRHENEGIMVVQREAKLRIGWPRTQKVGDPEEGLMTKEEYRRSCEDVLTYACGMIGIELTELERA